MGFSQHRARRPGGVRLRGRRFVSGSASLLVTLLMALLGAMLAASRADAAASPYGVTTDVESPWAAYNAVTFVGGVATVSLPFSFDIYGTSYSWVTIGANATLQFASSYAGSNESCLPSGHFTRPTILPLWSSFSMASSGEDAWYSTFDNPNCGNVFVVRWSGHEIGVYPAATISFEVVLVAATNQILMSFDDAVPAADIGSATSCRRSLTTTTPRRAAIPRSARRSASAPAPGHQPRRATATAGSAAQPLTSTPARTSRPGRPRPVHAAERRRRGLRCGRGKGLQRWGPSVYADLAYAYGPIDYVDNLTAPSFSYTGTAVVGTLLSVTNEGSWRPTPTGCHYEWARCQSMCSLITGQTGPSARARPMLTSMPAAVEDRSPATPSPCGRLRAGR